MAKTPAQNHGNIEPNVEPTSGSITPSDNIATPISTPEVKEESAITDVVSGASVVLPPDTGTVSPIAHDPFDLGRLRLSQDFASSVCVKKILTTVSCGKPNRHDFVRVHPDEQYRFQALALEDKRNRDLYLVDASLQATLAAECFAVCLFLAITKGGTPFIWPVKLPGQDGKTNPWNQSALAAALEAESHWVRLASNMDAGCYDVHVAEGDLGEPLWPELGFAEILKLAFADKIIRDPEHPFLRSLRGEA